MNFFDRMLTWIGLDTTQSTSDNQLVETLQNTLDRARRFKQSGKYDEACEALEQALELIAKRENEALTLAIRLQYADVLIRQENFIGAASLLDELAALAHQTESQPQIAYIEIGRGTLAQAQGQVDQARHYYEEALRIAQTANAVGAEGRAQGHLADIYLRDGNASYASYLLQEALPKLNTSGDVEMSSYFVGRLGEAMIVNGKISEGQQLLGRALRLAEHMEYREYERLWRQALAVEAVREGLYEEARRHLMLVLSHINTAQSEIDPIITLCRLSKICARLGEDDAALDYARQAYERLEENDPTDANRILAIATYGVSLRIAGDHQTAYPHLSAVSDAYAEHERTSAEYSYLDILRNLGAVQTETGALEQAQATYEKALALADSDEQILDLAGIHRDLGIFHARRKDMQAAVAAWMHALRIYEQQGHHTRVARLYCDVANVRRQFGQSKRAMRDYEQALMTLGSVDDIETRGVVLSNAATAYIDHGDVQTAESFFVESIQIAQKLQARPTEAMRRGNYGWFLVMTGRPKAALEVLDYAIRQSENMGMMLQAAVQTDNVGLAYDALENYEQALAYHAKAWNMLREGGDMYWKGILSANLGHTLLSLKRLDDAQASLQAALEAGRNTQRSDLIVRALTGFVRYALIDNRLDDIPPHIEEAITLAEQIGARHLLVDALLLRSQWHARYTRQAEASSDWARAKDLLAMLLRDTTKPAWLD